MDVESWPATVILFDVVRGAMHALLELQREIQRSLASEFRIAGDDGSALSVIVLMTMAFAFGAVHAVTPGHGKSVVAAHFLGQGGTPRRGLIMSAKVIVTHVLSAILLVLAATFLIDVSFGVRPADFPMVRLVSYAGVAVIGGWLLWRARHHEPMTPHPAAKEGALPYFAGMSPCPLTTIIMVVALANGVLTLGLLVSASMAFGMTVTVTVLALAVIISRVWLLGCLARYAARVDRIARFLEILGRCGCDGRRAVVVR